MWTNCDGPRIAGMMECVDVWVCVSQIARVRSLLTLATHQFFTDQGFICVHTPVQLVHIDRQSASGKVCVVCLCACVCVWEGG